MSSDSTRYACPEPLDRLADSLFQLKIKRAEDRKAFIAAGLMDDGTPRALADAITVVGTCMAMCPEYNIVERMVDKSIDQLERDPVTGEVDPARCVTKYPRASAGKEPPLPTEIRPPQVLKVRRRRSFRL